VERRGLATLWFRQMGLRLLQQFLSVDDCCSDNKRQHPGFESSIFSLLTTESAIIRVSTTRLETWLGSYMHQHATSPLEGSLQRGALDIGILEIMIQSVRDGRTWSFERMASWFLPPPRPCRALQKHDRTT
jgi:hypothetical protein